MKSFIFWNEPFAAMTDATPFILLLDFDDDAVDSLDSRCCHDAFLPVRLLHWEE